MWDPGLWLDFSQLFILTHVMTLACHQTVHVNSTKYSSGLKQLSFKLWNIPESVRANKLGKRHWQYQHGPTMEWLRNEGDIKVTDSRQVLDTCANVYVRKSAHLWNTQMLKHVKPFPTWSHTWPQLSTQWAGTEGCIRAWLINYRLLGNILLGSKQWLHRWQLPRKRKTHGPLCALWERECADFLKLYG